tara:strand:- start:177628 stop:178770 length:1143 start_codon:yes stop_codon:yes gene_type:complete
LKKFVVYIFLLLASNSLTASSPGVEKVLDEMVMDITKIQNSYNLKTNAIHVRNNQIDLLLLETLGVEKKLDLLIEKNTLEKELSELANTQYLEISKVRYLKGVQVIRLLYGKILALDHHFSAVSSLHDINSISNPNSFPEFVKATTEIKNTVDRKQGFDLSGVLGNNVYTSVVHTLVSVFVGNGNSKQEKSKQLSEIECIIDFSLSVSNDLNTIYFETAFLQKQNENIKQDLIQLFSDFTKPLNYKKSLEEFRNTDGWDEIRNSLDTYLRDLNAMLKDKTKQAESRRMRVNLEFGTDRLLQFLNQYNTFINQGTNFYEKFHIMLSSYEEKKQCTTKVPVEYKKLKDGIALTIDKFNTAYKPVEVNGTKLKEILYGLNEFN